MRIGCALHSLTNQLLVLLSMSCAAVSRNNSTIFLFRLVLLPINIYVLFADNNKLQPFTARRQFCSPLLLASVYLLSLFPRSHA